MTMRKTKLGLVGSLIALALALVVTATSTYAWFSTNNSVSTSDMKVQAVAAGAFLEIKNNPGDDQYSKTVTVSNGDKASMGLVTPKAISDDTITWGQSSSTDAGDASLVALTDLTELSDASSNYLKNSFRIHNASVSSATRAIEVSATITLPSASKVTGKDQLEESVRILIVAKQVSGETTTYSYCLLKHTGDDSESAVVTYTAEEADYNPLPSTATSSATLVSSMAADSTFDVDVYVYFDGQDSNAKTNSQIATGTLDTSKTVISLTFSEVSES